MPNISLRELLKILIELEKVEKPTYLGHFHSYNSLILNRKNEHFFIKRHKHVPAGEWHKYLIEGFFFNDTSIQLYYLFHLIERGNKDNFQSPMPLTDDERMRFIFATTKFWQDKLPKHKERLKNIKILKDINDLDLFKTIEKLFESRTLEEEENKKKLKELENKFYKDISDEDLLKEYLYLIDEFDRPLTKISGFQDAAVNLTKLISELFKQNIFMGYKKGFIGLKLAFVIKNFPKILSVLYIFNLNLDMVDSFSKIHYKRLKGLQKSLNAIIDKMKKTFSGSDAEDIGWIDLTLMISPALTFKNNLEKQLKSYRKLFNDQIKKTGQIKHFYEKKFIKALYNDINEECKTSNIDKKPIDILLDVLWALADILECYNNIYSTNYKHLSYDDDNIKKIIHSKDETSLPNNRQNNKL